MEETVRNLLQSQGSPGQNGEGTVNIMKVYQVLVTYYLFFCDRKVI